MLRSSGTLLPRPALYFFGPLVKSRGFGNSESGWNFQRPSLMRSMPGLTGAELFAEPPFVSVYELAFMVEARGGGAADGGGGGGMAIVGALTGGAPGGGGGADGAADGGGGGAGEEGRRGGDAGGGGGGAAGEERPKALRAACSAREVV